MLMIVIGEIMNIGFWVHERFMDCFIEITKISYQDDKRIKCKALWWNLGFVGQPYQITFQPKTITILKEDLKSWKRVSVETLMNSRVR